MEQAAWSFGLLQTQSVFAILFQRYLTDLFQQILLALSQKQNLVLPKVSQFTGGFPATDTALMAPKPSRESRDTTQICPLMLSTRCENPCRNLLDKEPSRGIIATFGPLAQWESRGLLSPWLQVRVLRGSFDPPSAVWQSSAK